MRTQVLADNALAQVWLEHDSNNGSSERTPVVSFPFTIGRNDGAELHIDSSQVSREHAVITKQGRKYRVRDLGSTNGTFLNGRQIDEAMLCDGDLLVVADVEFTFYCGGEGARRTTATEVISSPREASPEDAIWESILAVRRTHEMVTQGCLRISYQPIVQLSDGKTFGYEAFAVGGAEATTRCEPLVPPVECRAGARLRQLFRRLAVEEAATLPAGGRLLVAVTAAESAEPSLVSHLCQLRSAIGSRQLVVEIPDSAVRSTADFRALLACLRDVQIQVAYDNYASGKARITEHKDVAPDFVKLAPSMFQSIRRGPDRQRQVQLIVQASQELGCGVIATGIDSEADLQICRDLGCTMAQGNQFGTPQSAAGLATSAVAKS